LNERLLCPVCNTEIRPEDPVIFQDGKTYHLSCLQPDPPRPARSDGDALRGRTWGAPAFLGGALRAPVSLLRHSR
jgi:hypothetical protein